MATLSSCPFDRIGTLHRSPSPASKVVVSSDVHPHHSLDVPLEPDRSVIEKVYGPYNTKVDFWNAQFDIRARMAMDHRFPPHRRLAQYLLNREAARVVGLREEMGEKRSTLSDIPMEGIYLWIL